MVIAQHREIKRLLVLSCVYLSFVTFNHSNIFVIIIIFHFLCIDFVNRFFFCLFVYMYECFDSEKKHFLRYD